MGRVHLEIWNASGELVEHGAFDLPAILGRGEAASVRFDTDRTIISRRHVEIREQDGGLVAINLTSSSQTIVDGEALVGEGQAAALRSGTEIFVGDHRITVRFDPIGAQPGPADEVISHGVAALAIITPPGQSLGSKSKTIPIEAKGLTIVKEADGGLTAVADAPSAAVPIVRINFSSDGGTLEKLDTPNAVDVRINKTPVLDGYSPLRHFDLIEIDGMRIEVAGDSPVYLRCINPSCGRINPYSPSDNCIYCGHRLVEAQSVYTPRNFSSR